MYAFIVDVANYLKFGKFQYFLVFFIVIWFRWFVVNISALKYASYKDKFKCTKSVIIPVVDEDPEVFKRVLGSITKQRPTQIIVVVNGPYNKTLKELCESYKTVEYHWTRKAGKRNAIKLAMKYVRGDITILVDSDTIWTKNALSELVKPFRDNEIGGVTTRQRISEPTKNLRHRLCDWLEDIRTYGSMMAMSSNRQVGCLPGRTIAIRSNIIREVLNDFMKETFLGFHKEVSDDRSLTNYVLKKGYKTVMQSTSVVYTEAPETWKKYIRQQLRWSEGSQYNNIKMSGWMIKNARLMFFIFWTDTLIPFLLWGLYISLFINYIFFRARLDTDVAINIHTTWIVILLSFTGAYFSYAIRQLPAIYERKSHLIYIPFYILFLSFVMAPIRIIGFAKLADDLGWGTRGGGYGGSKPGFKRKTNEVSYA